MLLRFSGLRRGAMIKVNTRYTVWATVAAGLVVLGYILWVAAPITPSLPKPPLRDLARAHDIELGNYAALKLLDEKPYSAILTSQYSFLSVDGNLNWAFNDGSLRPSATAYDYTNPDKIFDYAKQHNMPVQAHHLVWGEEKWLPGWLKNGRYSPAQLLDIMHRHIAEVSTHYRGQIREWTVVNEAFTRSQHVNGLNDWWADHTGDTSYISKAFIWAHQADPKAKLLLNDFGNETQNSVSNAMYTYIKKAKAEGVPIDGIGMQMHIAGDKPPNKQDVISNMQRFAQLGVDVYVTEFDVNMTNVKASDHQREQIEAQIYYDMVRACIESKACHSFAQLGITDKNSWYNEMGYKNSEPLMFNNRYRPKPAFYSFRLAWLEP